MEIIIKINADQYRDMHFLKTFSKIERLLFALSKATELDDKIVLEIEKELYSKEYHNGLKMSPYVPNNMTVAIRNDSFFD